MPGEYEALVAALKLTDIQFAEYGWKKRPDGVYGVVSLDMEKGAFDGDDRKQDRVWEASVDVFFPKIVQRESIVETIEEVLTEICGNSWELNSSQHESGTGLFHMEWVCDVMDSESEEGQ